MHNPFIYAQLPNEGMAHKICGRSMLTKCIYDVLIEGESVNEVVLKLKDYDVENKLAHIYQNHIEYEIFIFGKKCSHDENIHNIKLLEQPFLSYMTGDVDLHSAEIEYHLVADYGDWTHLGESQPRDTPKKVYLCRYIAGSNRDIIRKFSLKREICWFNLIRFRIIIFNGKSSKN